MKIGTKSILFGVHQFLWHPLTVGLAWRRLFCVWPTWREWFCIFVHDLGYWGKPNIDGPEGREHPKLGARLAWHYLDTYDGRNVTVATIPRAYHDLTLYHSREYAKLHNEDPSLLCWADKYSVLCEPRWFYLLRARLSGEIKEFKSHAVPYIGSGSDRLWLNWYRLKIANLKEIREILDSK